MRSLPFNKSALFLCVLVACNAVSAEGYTESGQPGLPESWITAEFKKQWGLEAIGAQYAYARGYNGEGVKIGIFDQSVLTHPEFSGRINKVDAAEPYNFEEDPNYPVYGEINFGDHGTHVAGIAAAARDGQGMQGVAYSAGLVSAKVIDNDSNYFEKLINSDTRIFNNSWGAPPDIEKQENGEDDYFPDDRWKYVQITQQDIDEQFTADDILLLTQLSKTPVPEEGLDRDDDSYSTFSALIRAAHAGKLIVFSAGNYNNYNIPSQGASLPYFVPDLVQSYIVTTNLNQDDILDLTSDRCGYTASYCLSAPGTDIYSTIGQTDYPLYFQTGEKKIIPGYGKMSGTSMAAPMVSGAAAVLMQRFPYMTAAQIGNVLLTTATDLGEKGIDEIYGWGKLNLKSAINGPKKFVMAADIPADLYIAGSFTQQQFIANIPGVGEVVEAGTSNERICSARECGFDSWTNDIDGHGGLTKTGKGILALTGNNSYLGKTLIEQGSLIVNGALSSDVSVLDSGTLAGSGSVGSLTARRGSIVAPGNGIGTLRVARDVRFEPGSHYRVEVGPEKHSDGIQAAGVARIDGGSVEVSLENSGNLLTQREVYSLSGQQYRILSAQQGVKGQFDSVAPEYLFLGTTLQYQPNQIQLNIGRNATSFASIANTPNERAVAAAADALKTGDPVYESVIRSGTASEARQAFRQLSGQIHADTASALINESRYLRETLNARLRQAQGLWGPTDIKADEAGAWTQLSGSWSHASGESNATGYQASTRGVIVGVDSTPVQASRLGLATGYTRTSLKGGYGSSADSDNYSLALYGSKQYGDLALRTGAGYTWHRIDTARSVNYGAQSDREKAKYGARTGQLFVEAGYSIESTWVDLEPFANLSYASFTQDRIAEQGGAAALAGNKQHTEAILSTAGVRIEKRWQTGKSTSLGLLNELGWQHQYGDRNRDVDLSFKGGADSFTVSSVPLSRDGVVLKVGVELAMDQTASLSLGYAGLLSQNHQDNRVNAGFVWRF